MASKKSHTPNRLMIFNVKGGVGKTAISLNMALTFGYGVITNDAFSLVDQVLDEGNNVILSKNQSLPNNIPDDWPIIFDFGGYPDKRAVKALKLSDFCLIPILPYIENMQTNLDFIKEITNNKKESRIIVVVNKSDGEEFKVVKNAINGFYPAIKVFNLKKSAAFRWMIQHKKSIADLSKIHKQHARHFKIVAEQFDNIFQYIGKK